MAKNPFDWPVKSPIAVKKPTTPVAIPCVLVGRMIEQFGSFRLRNGHGSGIIKLALRTGPTLLRSGNVKPLVQPSAPPRLLSTH